MIPKLDLEIGAATAEAFDIENPNNTKSVRANFIPENLLLKLIDEHIYMNTKLNETHAVSVLEYIRKQIKEE
jgi:hypothetical protein